VSGPFIPTPGRNSIVGHRVVSPPGSCITAIEYELSDEARRALTVDLPPGALFPQFELGDKIEPQPVSEEYEAELRNAGVSDEFLRAIQRDRERFVGRRHGVCGFIRWALGI
jgi:hypothetical protein